MPDMLRGEEPSSLRHEAIDNGDLDGHKNRNLSRIASDQRLNQSMFRGRMF